MRIALHGATPIMELAHSGGGNGDLALGMFLVLLTDGIHHSPRHVTFSWISGRFRRFRECWVGGITPCAPSGVGWRSRILLRIPSLTRQQGANDSEGLQSRLHMATSQIDSLRRIQVCPRPPGCTVFLVTYRMVTGTGPCCPTPRPCCGDLSICPTTRGIKEIPRQPSGDLTCRRGPPGPELPGGPKHAALAEVVRRAYKRWAMEVDRRDKQSRSHRG